MKAYAITDIGKKRSFNQDYAWMTTDEIGKLPNPVSYTHLDVYKRQ